MSAATDQVIYSTATEFCRVPVSIKKNGAIYDPTSDVVRFAFPITRDSSAATLLTGSWEIDTSTTPTTFWARCLIGSGVGGNPLTVGEYFIYVKITDNPETPVIAGGQLLIRP